MKKIYLHALVFLISVSQWGFSQDAVLQNTNIKELQKMEQEFRAAFELRQEKVKKYAEANKVLIDHFLPDGKVISIIDIDENGKPIYRETHNAKASATISTNKVYPSSTAPSRYNLSGRGFTVGEWDGGTTRITHREFQGRAIQADNGSMALSEHATHVGGTLIAGGVAPTAKGMAFQATLLTNDWNNDDAEMTSRAAQGLLVSNHSYGTPSGWSWEGSWVWNGNDAINPLYDYKFGFYDSQARDWDRIAKNAPYYLITKSAGNSRGDGPQNGARPQNGPYDCIPTYSVAKNILTVGAVRPLINGYTTATAVQMTTFSSWGPADDGRIKPDVVGDGEGVISCGIASDVQTVALDGTSMSGPSVAGSCLLLQEMYNNTHRGAKMRSSTLKGLVTHTADECWNFPGPDYRYGWGLMNTRKAADVIYQDSVQSRIIEEVLENQEVKQYVVFAKGNEKLSATLCWTDYQGTPVAAAYNNRTPMLVNNLNIRLQGPGVGIDSLPWKLDPENPQNGATKGNNLVDNVEKVEFNTPVAGGVYTITVSHTGNLFTNGTTPQNQDFSLIVTGIIAGDTNRTCLPLQIHNARTGRFDDGSGANKDYFNGASCSWVINPVDSAAIVLAVLKNFNVHPSDTLYFYNGDQPGGALLKKYTGSTLPDTVFSNTPQMYINFKSDGANSAAGWEIEYSAIRKPKFTFTSASSSICVGDNVVFTAQNLDVDPPIGWSYTWTLPGAENTTMTGATVSPVYAVEGTYPVTLTVTNRYGPVSVTKTDFILVKSASTNNFTAYAQSFSDASFPSHPGNPELNWITTVDANPWQRNTSAPFSAPASLRIFNNTSLKNVRELISPAFNIENVPANQRMLSFHVAFARRAVATASDRLQVLYSINCGKSWTSVYSKTHNSLSTIGTGANDIETLSFFPEPFQYRKDSISLATLPPNTGNLMLKFEMTSDKGNFLYLDDIRLNQTFVSIEDLMKGPGIQIGLQPNPTEGNSELQIFNPTGKSTLVELMDVLGKKLSETTIQNFENGGHYSASTRDLFGTLPAGIYNIRVRNGSAAKTIKWMVQ